MSQNQQGASPIVYTSPIIFSKPMIRAMLEDRKSQTRRLITSQWSNVKVHQDMGERCLLWVRETWADVNTENGPALAYRAGGLHFCVDDAYPVEYERYPGMEFTMWCGDLVRGEPGHSWRSPLHMPRWASRLTLELTDVRVQRLQDITTADAIAEGIEPVMNERGDIAGWKSYDSDEQGFYLEALNSYDSLWESLHGEGSWDANPEIIALTFNVHRQNVVALCGTREVA